MPVELIVPDHVVVAVVVDLVVGRPEGIGGRVAGAARAFLEGMIRAASNGELLTEAVRVLRLWRAAKGTRPRGARAALGETLGVELEHEPPFHRLSGLEEWRRGPRRRGGLPLPD